MQRDIDVEFIDASDWENLSWYSTGGTRAKKLLQNHIGDEFYFKCSEKKPAQNGVPGKYYKYEFWNEIIAYQIGKTLGLEMLRYDIAIYQNEIGCISPKMINENEELIEVGRYMTVLNPRFSPEINSLRKEYTFQLLQDTLNYFNLSNYISYFLEVLIFDALIGNTDRHQENWAFIGRSSSLNINYFKDQQSYEGKLIQLLGSNIIKVAPIYDCGSSLARELTEEGVDLKLTNSLELEKYVEKGSAELHWEKKKLSHFDLVKTLLKTNHAADLIKASMFLDNWQTSHIEAVITNIDKKLPASWCHYSIPLNRKMLISKLLTLRFNKLMEILRA